MCVASISYCKPIDVTGRCPCEKNEGIHFCSSNNHEVDSAASNNRMMVRMMTGTGNLQFTSYACFHWLYSQNTCTYIKSINDFEINASILPHVFCKYTTTIL